MPAAQHYETSAKYAVSPTNLHTGHGSTNCAILPFRMEEHGKDGKHQPVDVLNILFMILNTLRTTQNTQFF